MDEFGHIHRQYLRTFRTTLRVADLVMMHNRLDKETDGKSDLLRAATVLLHAALEDALRGFIFVCMRSGDPTQLSDPDRPIGLPRSQDDRVKQNDTLTLLARDHRSKSVQQVIDESLDAYLSRSNFNNKKELFFWLKRCGVGTVCGRIAGSVDAVSELMDRRHQIVHRADYDSVHESALEVSELPVPISPEQVARWCLAVRHFEEGLQHHARLLCADRRKDVEAWTGQMWIDGGLRYTAEMVKSDLDPRDGWVLTREGNSLTFARISPYQRSEGGS